MSYRITIIAVLAALLTATALPASGAPPSSPVQAQIDAHLAAYPGGVQINETEISYGGKFIITFVRPDVTILGPDCPSGWFCFYDQLSYGYPRGKLSDCGWQDLTDYGWQNRTESAHYNMNSGMVTFINHGAWPDHSGDYGTFYVSIYRRALPDTYPYRNSADHVYRFC